MIAGRTYTGQGGLEALENAIQQHKSYGSTGEMDAESGESVLKSGENRNETGENRTETGDSNIKLGER